MTPIYPSTDALLTAIDAGDVPAIQSLIAKGVDVNAANEQGISPMMVAALKGNTEIAKLLIGAGGDVNQAVAAGAS